VCEGRFGEVGLCELDVAGAVFFGESGTVEAEPSAVVDLAFEVLYVFCGFEGAPAGVELAETGLGAGFDGAYPVSGGEGAVSFGGKMCGEVEDGGGFFEVPFVYFEEGVAGEGAGPEVEVVCFFACGGCQCVAVGRFGVLVVIEVDFSCEL